MAWIQKNNAQSPPEHTARVGTTGLWGQKLMGNQLEQETHNPTQGKNIHTNICRKNIVLCKGDRSHHAGGARHACGHPNARYIRYNQRYGTTTWAICHVPWHKIMLPCRRHNIAHPQQCILLILTGSQILRQGGILSYFQSTSTTTRKPMELCLPSPI